jgi:hypothetical protein
MADTIVDINFTGVTIQEATDGGHIGTLAGTLQVDYTTGVVVVEPGTTLALTFSGSGTGGTQSYLTFQLAGFPSGPFTLTSTAISTHQVLTPTWTGQTPTVLTSALLVDAHNGHTYSLLNPATNHLTSAVVCFAAGTLIRTPRGDAPVESLQVGDLVVTASGEQRPIKWIGHSDFDLRSHPDPRPVFPVRIAADAFGPGRPSQDLYLSSGHSVCVDLVGEVFIPAGHLINGATIAQIEVEEISYWHVELDSHNILLANNQPAESYLAMANRGFFEERRGLLPANEEGRERTHADFCRPVVLDGPVLAFARQRLQTRAEAIGRARSRRIFISWSMARSGVRSARAMRPCSCSRLPRAMFG